jgi:hypothetical protein
MQARASRLTVKRVITTTWMNVSPVAHNRSWSLLMRRYWLNREKVRSTTLLRGNTLKFRWGMSLCQSTSSPYSTYSTRSSAHPFATFSDIWASQAGARPPR